MVCHSFFAFRARAGEGGGRPQGRRLADPTSSAGAPAVLKRPSRQSPGPARVGPSPGARAGRCQLFTYVGLHTQLRIVYVRVNLHKYTHTIGNCLCTWEPPRPDLAGMLPPPLLSEPRAGEDGGRPQGLGRQAGRCQLFVWVGPSSRTHIIANYLCRSRRTHTITNFTWEPPRPNIAGMLPNPQPPTPLPPPCCWRQYFKVKHVSKDTQEMLHSRRRAIIKHQKDERTKSDKTIATYQTIVTRTKKNCNRGTASERSGKLLGGD